MPCITVPGILALFWVVSPAFLSLNEGTPGQGQGLKIQRGIAEVIVGPPVFPQSLRLPRAAKRGRI